MASNFANFMNAMSRHGQGKNKRLDDEDDDENEVALEKITSMMSCLKSKDLDEVDYDDDDCSDDYDNDDDDDDDDEEDYYAGM